MGTETLKYRRICRAIRDAVWAIQPQRLVDIIDVMSFKAAGGELSPDEIRAYVGMEAAAPRAQTAGGGIAVLGLRGIISHRIEMVDDISGPGGTSIEGFRERFRTAMSSDAVGTVLIDVDSPGGAVDGVPEIAAEIREARGSKRIIAHANTLAASAAYWIASAADEISMAPSAEVGSIGVFAAHSDISERLEQMGERVTLVHAGRYKVEGSPFEPLSDEAREEIQAKVDTRYEEFVRDVADGRGVSRDKVLSDFGEGRTMMAAPALASGMVDHVETFDALVARLQGNMNPRRSVAFSAADRATYPRIAGAVELAQAHGRL